MRREITINNIEKHPEVLGKIWNGMSIEQWNTIIECECSCGNERHFITKGDFYLLSDNKEWHLNHLSTNELNEIVNQ